MKHLCYNAFVLVIVFGVAIFKSKGFQVIQRGPFTMVMVFEGAASKTPASPTGIHRLIAYRSDGSYVTKTITLPGYKDSGDRSMTLRSERKTVYLLDTLKLKSTTSLPGLTVLAPALNSTCAETGPQPMTFLKKDIYKGYETFVYTRMLKSPASDQIVTRWLAPGLQCRDIQSTLEVKEASGAIQHFHNYAISIVEGEPDPALFAVPDDYTEASPSEMEQHRASTLGRTLLPSQSQMLEHKDEQYLRSRAK